MARIEYNILDLELLELFAEFLPDVSILEVGGKMVVPSSEYDRYLSLIEAELDEMGWPSEWEDLWNDIDLDVRIWSTERGDWV